MKEPHDVWMQLVGQVRRARAAGLTTRAGVADDESAPFGFATRVVSGFREWQQSERRLALWQRLAWRSAFASALFCGALFLGQRQAGPGEILLTPPAIDWPLE